MPVLACLHLHIGKLKSNRKSTYKIFDSPSSPSSSPTTSNTHSKIWLGIVLHHPMSSRDSIMKVSRLYIATRLRWDRGMRVTVMVGTDLISILFPRYSFFRWRGSSPIWGLRGKEISNWWGLANTELGWFWISVRPFLQQFSMNPGWMNTCKCFQVSMCLPTQHGQTQS